MLLRAFRPGAEPRRGVVLIAVLVVVVLLTLAAYQYSELMLAEYKASISFAKAAQARAAAESGINYASMLLSDKTAFSSVLNSNPHDNPTAFQSIPVSGSSGPRQAFFSILAPMGPDEQTGAAGPSSRYGVTDESGKINLNALLRFDSSGAVGVQILTALGFPDDTANSVLDWIDEDSTVRPGGAEDETYSQLGYRCKNGPFDTLEELLYVKGVTTELLYGNDTNRNGFLDPEETTSGSTLGLGMQAYLTVYSREQNVDNDGKPRLYVNSGNTLSLYSKLVDAVGQDMASYLLLYRRKGPAPSPIPPGTRTMNIAASQIQRGDLQLSILGGGRNLSSLFELVGTKVLIANPNPRQPSTLVECPLNNSAQARDLLPKLLDKLTTSTDQDLPARVNVNTAPEAVLKALPGLTPADVTKITSARPNPSTSQTPDPIFQTPAWLLTEAGLTPEALKSLDRFVTARTQVYRIQSVGHFAGRGPSVRLEAVVDTNRGRPRIVYWRDLSELGRGFNLPMGGMAP